MASSSISRNAGGNSFVPKDYLKTMINPYKEMIDMCPQFIKKISKHIDFQKCGWFVDGNKEKAMVVFKFTKGFWYISSGIEVAKKLGFTQPTVIYLYPRLKNNEFLMFEKTFHKICKATQPPPYTRQSFKAVSLPKHIKEGGSHKDDETDARVFNKFDVKVTDAMVNSTQVLHFPNKTSKHVLSDKQKVIYLRDVETGRVFTCPIVTSGRSKNEKHIGIGWYDYKSEKMLKVGDVLSCTIEDPSDYMNIKVIRI